MADEPLSIPFSLLVDGQNRIESKLDSGLAELRARLEEKASRVDVTRIEVKLDGHEKRIEGLEADKRLREERAKVHSQRDNQIFSRRQKIWGSTGVVLVVIATIVGPIVGALVH